MSAESIFKKPLNKRRIAVLTRIAERQAAGDDSEINYEDIPSLSDEQLANAYRPREKQLITARLDRDVLEWLKSYGDGYSTRLNSILRSVMDKAGSSSVHPRGKVEASRSRGKTGSLTR